MKRLLGFSLLLIFALSGAMADIYDDAPPVVRNNPYFMESLRSANNAYLAYEEGLYDDSVRYSQEAIRYAQLSDEYVENALKKKAATDTIIIAKQRMDWASSSAINARIRFPLEFNSAESYLVTAENYWRAESWENCQFFANMVIDALAFITEPGSAGTGTIAGGTDTITPPASTGGLPAQYTVRPWSVSGDCYWNIAGWPWVYNDPTQWRRLYEANKDKMPDPNNPDLIHPGMVMTIPSLSGEVRQGAWEETRTYIPFNR